MIAFIQRHYMKAVALVAFLALWQSFILITGVKEFIVPSPLVTFQRLFDPAVAQKYNWLKHIKTTASEVLLSFAATAVLGIGTAILITWSSIAARIFTPLLALLNSLPKIALAPLFLLWFGYGVIPNTLIAILIAFFPVIINTATGLNSVEEDLLDLVRYLGGTKWQVFKKIRIPNALPFIFAGLKLSATLSVVGAIVGEFIASSSGLGYVIQSAQALIDTPTMFAALLVIAVLGLGLFGAIAVAERLLVPYDVEALE